MTSLTEQKFVKLKKPRVLIEDFQGCGINSLLTFLHIVSPNHKISLDEIKRIFDYDKDGIGEERHRFNHFNNTLKEHKIPYKVYRSTFNSHQELLKYLNHPVPVYFSMKVITFIRGKFKYSNMTFNLGDERALFESKNHHLLLLVGYEDGGNKLYFVDPVYQLPYYSDEDLSDKEKLCVLDTRQFYECVKYIKCYIEFKYMLKLENKYKSENKSNEQKRLA